VQQLFSELNNIGLISSLWPLDLGSRAHWSSWTACSYAIVYSHMGSEAAKSAFVRQWRRGIILSRRSRSISIIRMSLYNICDNVHHTPAISRYIQTTRLRTTVGESRTPNTTVHTMLMDLHYRWTSYKNITKTL